MSLSNNLDRLVAPHSQLAHELLKKPYNFDSLGLHDKAQENALDKNLG